MFSGARALNCLPGSDGTSLSAAGVLAAGVFPGASAGAVQAGTAKLAEVTIAIAIRLRLMISVRLRAGYFESGVPRRAGRSVSSRPSARISLRKMPAGSPVRTGLTMTVTLSPGLIVFDFQPARTR